MRPICALALLTVLLGGCGGTRPAAQQAATSAPLQAALAGPTASSTAPSVIATALPTAVPAATSAAQPDPPSTPSPTASLFPAAAGWSQIAVSGTRPPERRDAALVYDPTRRRLILFGGRRGGVELDDTWAFDLQARSWQQLATGEQPRPAARFSVVADLDRQRNRIVLSTGQAGSNFFNDVWSFDLLHDRWSPVEAQGAAPRPRYGSAGGIGPQGGSLYLTHGFSDQGRFDDTWALDLATNTWQELTPAGELPLKRCLHAASVLAGDRLVLFGGCASGFGPCPLGDTWVFDAAAGSWQALDSQAAPEPRQFPSLVPLDEPARLLLFGGQAADNRNLNDSWVLNLETQTWAPLAPAGAAPPARHGHSMLWLADLQVALVFGGMGAEGELNDLWLLRPGVQ